MFVFLFYMFVIYFVCSVFLYCFVYCFVPHVYTCLFIFVNKFTDHSHRVETKLQLINIVYHIVGWDSSVGIATRYGLDGLGIVYRGGESIPAPVQTGPGAHTASYTMSTKSFPRVERPERGVEHPPTSSAEVKERVEL
jgi:hypothetical protein